MHIRNALPVAMLLPIGWVAPSARADGGRLCLSQRAGSCQISVFTTPTPVRVGMVDVSVLVQDARTHALVPDAKVVVIARPAHGPQPPVVVRASHAAATNRLLQAAFLDLPRAGGWTIDLDVACRGERFKLEMPLEVAGALPGWMELGPWLIMPLGPVLLFVTHHLLRLHDRAFRRTRPRK
jgi:hypothetical protein